MDSLPEERRTLFARYRVVDVARKVVGVGSVGTRCWVLLLSGNDDDNDPLFLQYKEAQRSVLAPYSKTPPWDCEGKRVVVGQRLIQGAPDIFLGWGIQIDGDPFLHAPAARHEGFLGVRPWLDAASSALPNTASSAAGRWPSRTPNRVTPRPSPVTSARVRAWTTL